MVVWVPGGAAQPRSAPPGVELRCEVLDQDLTLAQHLIPRPDFAVGVRAQLVDKDRNPTWQHARIEDVTRDEVLACFER